VFLAHTPLLLGPEGPLALIIQLYLVVTEVIQFFLPLLQLVVAVAVVQVLAIMENQEVLAVEAGLQSVLARLVKVQTAVLPARLTKLTEGVEVLLWQAPLAVFLHTNQLAAMVAMEPLGVTEQLMQAVVVAEHIQSAAVVECITNKPMAALAALVVAALVVEVLFTME
jgi:hypothetical protein